MNVLVAYATRHGATKGIAERIAQVLQTSGVGVTLRCLDDPEHLGDLARYDGFVIGAAAYFGQWMKEATAFVRDNRNVLERRPTWLFSSGPIGVEHVDKKGRDVVEASIPTEFRSLATEVQPRDEKVFFGALDLTAQPMGLAEGLMSRMGRMLPAIRDAMPSGDFRDWEDIEAWGRRIAAELQGLPVATPA